MIYLMDRAIGYYTDAAQITGIIYDSSTGEPIEGAIVEVLEHSGSVLKPRLTNEFGRYRRILDVGTYNFSFRAKGFLDQEISLVANNSAITDQDIYLDPAPIHQLNIRLVHESFELTLVMLSAKFLPINITLPTGILSNGTLPSSCDIFSLKLKAGFDILTVITVLPPQHIQRLHQFVQC